MIQRKNRVASQLIKVVSEIVLEELQESHLGFVTLLSADVSKDLKNAIVYYSVLGDDNQKNQTDKILSRNTKWIKKRVNQEIRLRNAIDITFQRDMGIDHTFEIQKILNKISDDRSKESAEDRGIE
jgi:ribosome-binding factor A